MKRILIILTVAAIIIALALGIVLSCVSTRHVKPAVATPTPVHVRTPTPTIPPYHTPTINPSITPEEGNG